MIIGIDIETNGLRLDGGIIWMLSVTRGKKTELFHNCKGIKKLPQRIVQELESPHIMKVVHSGVFDLPFLQYHLNIKVQNVWDSEVCEVVIQGLRVSFKRKNLEPHQLELLKLHSSKLMYVVQRYGYPSLNKSIVEGFINRPIGKPFSSEEKLYAVKDTKYLPSIYKKQFAKIESLEMLKVTRMENIVTERLSAMRVLGIKLNKKRWKEIADANEKEYERRLKKLPKGINWNSPKQVKELFMNRGIVMSSFSQMFDIYLETRDKMLGDFIYARELYKACSAYGNNWFTDGFIDSDDRIRCSVTQCINTGRMSMSNPNLQQLPGEQNKKPKVNRVMNLIAGGLFQWRHREAFIPEANSVFVSGDFGGQEIGIMAAASNETFWIDAMLKGEDIHSLMAQAIDPNEWASHKQKGCTFPKKCKCKGHLMLREPAKINNFMLAYGGGAKNLADSIGLDLMPLNVAQEFVKKQKRIVPALTRYLNNNGTNAINTKLSYSADPYKRRRVLTGAKEWQIRNQGKNNPIQSAAANMIKRAIRNLNNEWPMVLVWHDQIVLEVKETKALQAKIHLRSVMEEAAQYITGIKGLIKVEPTIQKNLVKH